MFVYVCGRAPQRPCCESPRLRDTVLWPCSGISCSAAVPYRAETGDGGPLLCCAVTCYVVLLQNKFYSCALSDPNLAKLVGPVLPISCTTGGSKDVKPGSAMSGECNV